MASSPPGSPTPSAPSRPMSSMVRPARSQSRMSLSSKHGGGSRASDEDGKTSVKVAIRVRPPLRPQDPGYDVIPQRRQKSMVTVTGPTSVEIDSAQGRKLFLFDRVFGEDVDQEGVWEYLTESVDAFIQGYNVSMLAYGQSGAGKSYTMGTSDPEDQADLEVMGVIPRAAASLFEKLAGPKAPSNRDSMSGLRAPKRYSAQPSPLSGKQFEKNWTLKATYVEIYNEHLRDLLVPDDVPLNERSQVAIREDTKGHILLTGLHAVEINSVDDLLATLNFGSNIRQTDSTAINAKSSRSHAVFSLNLVQRKPQATSKAEKRLSVPLEAMTGSETMMTIDSKFHFVDLAGSERLKNTGAQGDRAKEGISINAGLASLGKVISQLSSRQAGSHVSYRDSKLTRMLQDSLGGSAITYMIACVTPAEYHLSETLNTVQYAQRARAIQSKPRIQQNSDESDKQALIDRLKAEVAFLRDQIRSAEKDGPATNGLSGDNQSHSNEKELELQNQLFHSQESYEALSQRHAKLLSEMTKARDSERSENRAHEEREGEFATERIRRSNNFAEAAEQVVLEYEETIRSLEHSISSTRAALSNTEAILLERESALAYTETVNTQLQVQVGKLKESVRDLEESESSLIENERRGEAQYHYLENELEGHTSNGDEKSAKIEELTRENARLTGNEVVREGYVNDIEESLRLAELNQGDLKKEVRRLAEVVERHRGIENLDKLLHDLDGVRTVDAKHARRRTSSRDITPHSRHDSYSNLRGRRDTIHEDDEHGDNSQYDGANSPPSLSPGSAARSEAEGPVDNGESIEEVAAPLANQHNREDPIEVKVVTDKLENVTKELLNLKVEHGATVTQYEDLTAKYEEALSAITELQHDSMRHDSNRDSFASVSARPLSFLADARVNELRENGGQYSSSRSLSSELSLAGESPSLTQLSDAETAIVKKSDSGDVSGEAQNEAIAAEVEELRRLGDENEKSQMELARQYAELHRKHVETMDVVEELKSQVHRAKMSESNAQRHSLPALRRKSSHGIMVIDRAHRSFASLRNIATEHFEGQPDVMQNFELNLNSAMHELHTRSERVQQLEAEIAATKKEMEMKMTIISGLTRERASIKQSPIDMSAMSAMRDQLLQSENQIRILQETHRAREEQLGAELGTLRAAMAAHSKEVQAVAERAAVEQEDLMMDQEKKISLLEAELTSKATQDGKIAILEAELKSWEERHETALASLQTSEKKHLSTIAELESRVAVIRSESAAETQLNKSVAPEEKDGSISETDIEQYRAKHEDLVASLQHEVDEHKAIVAKNAEQIAELQASHSVTISQLEEALESMMVEDATKTAQLSEEKQELEVQHKKSIARVAELEEAQAQTKSELDEAEHMKQELEAELEASRSHALTLEQQIAEFGETAKAHAQVLSELESHKTKVSKLEQQLDEQNLVIKTHEDGLALLRANHARDIEEIKTSHAIEIEDAKEKAADVKKAAMADMLDQHQLRLDAAYQGSSEVRNELANAVSHIGEAFDGEETILFNLHERIDELVLVHIELEDEKKKAAAREQELETVRTELRELEDVSAGLAELLAQTSAGAKLKDKRATLTEQLSAVKEEMVDLAEKNNKNSNLVEQLEDQLTQIYDVHKEETKRLSTLQGQRSSEIDMANQARNKVESELEAVREKYTGLQAQLEQLTLTNNAAGIRTSDFNGRFNTKTASVQSFVSPPPSIPLPPIPNGGNAPSPSTNGIHSPRESRSRPLSKEDQILPTIRDSDASTGSFNAAQAALQAEQEAEIRDKVQKIRDMENKLAAEIELTASLEQCVVELEAENKKLATSSKQAIKIADERAKKVEEKAKDELKAIEAQIYQLKRALDDARQKQKEEADRASSASMLRIEEEKRKWEQAERAKATLAQTEKKMGIVKKKKGGGINCFG